MASASRSCLSKPACNVQDAVIPEMGLGLQKGVASNLSYLRGGCLNVQGSGLTVGVGFDLLDIAAVVSRYVLT